MAINNNFSTEVLALVEDLTTGEMVTIDKAIWLKSFAIGKLPESHTVVPGIREGNVVPIVSTAPNYASFPYKDPNSCTIPACDLDLDFDAKVWQVGQIACKVPICVNTFDDNFLLFWGSYKRLFGDENLDSALMKYIIDKFQTNLDAALWRVAWFGDRGTASSNPFYAYLRPIDGIFTQAEADGGVKIVITENTSGTAGAPVPLTGEAVYNYLSDAYNRAIAFPWYDQGTIQFEMTYAMAAAWVAWLNSLGDRSQYNCECFDPKTLQAQRSFNVDMVLKAFGIPVFVRREFDGVIQALNLGHPYRAMLTSRDNILFGTSEIDQLPAFKVYFSEDDDQIYLKGGATIGATLVTDEYVYLGAETV